MVRSDVRDAGQLRASRHGFELCVRQLDHDPRVGLNTFQQPEQSHADVSAHDIILTGRFQHRTYERGRGRLTRRPRDRRDGRGAEIQKQLGHRGHGHASVLRRGDRREVARHALGHKDTVRASGVLGTVAAEGQGGVDVRDGGECVRQRLCGTSVGHGDTSSLAGEEADEVDALDPEADHSNASPSEVRLMGDSG